MRTVLIAALVGVACASLSGLSASGAAAAGLAPPVADCNANARLTHHYTISQLRVALASMPADVREYTDCADVIRRQLLIQLGGLSAGQDGQGQGGGSFVPVWLIVVLGLALAGALGFGVLAVRDRRRGAGGPPLH